MFFLNNNFLFVKKQGPGFSKWWTQVFKMVDRGFHFGGPRFFLKILVDRGLVDRGFLRSRDWWTPVWWTIGLTVMKKVETFAYDGKFRRTRVHGGGGGCLSPLPEDIIFRVFFMLF